MKLSNTNPTIAEKLPSTFPSDAAVIEEAQRIRESGNCAQSTAGALLRAFNFPTEAKILEESFYPYGSGFGIRSMCGAISGSLGALSSLLYTWGFEKEEILEIAAKFREKFYHANFAYHCQDLLFPFRNIDGTINMDASGKKRKM